MPRVKKKKLVKKKAVKKKPIKKQPTKKSPKKQQKKIIKKAVDRIKKVKSIKKIKPVITHTEIDLKKQPVLTKYQVQTDEMKVDVTITGGENLTKRYLLDRPKLGLATKALLEEIKIDLISKVSISSSEILDVKEATNIKNKFKENAQLILKERLANLDENITNILIGILLQDMLGLGEVDCLLADDSLEEIVIMSATENIRLFHKEYGWLESNVKPATESQIHNYSNIIARRVGRQITTLSPLLDAHLLSGDRANAVLFPISSKGNTITIRKFARDPWTVTDLIRNKTCSVDVFALIWLCIQYEMSIIVSGGTGSGKTTMLNVIMPFIPPNHRLVSIEDTRELQLPDYLFWCPLTTREPNPEGRGKIDMLDLLVNSLRMRPDRVVLGEVRKKEQAEVLFEAMHTGHSVYSTVHADSSAETIRRLVNPPIEVPPNLLSAVNLNVVMFRDRRRGLRRVLQVSEFVDAEGEIISVKPNILYRWRADTDEIAIHNIPLRLFEDLNLFTGMTLPQIKKDIDQKKKILNWMVKNNTRTVTDVGKVMRDYYLNPDALLKRIK
jgi:archaeal flagellar protein FlaI